MVWTSKIIFFFCFITIFICFSLDLWQVCFLFSKFSCLFLECLELRVHDSSSEIFFLQRAIIFVWDGNLEERIAYDWLINNIGLKEEKLNKQMKEKQNPSNRMFQGLS